MNPRTKSALLWGLVGFMTFMVLFQAYVAFVSPVLSFWQGTVIAVLVGFGVALGAYTLEYRIAEWSAQRAHEKRDRSDDGT